MMQGPVPHPGSRDVRAIARSIEMFKLFGVCLLAALSGTSLAQMMGGPVSTSQYFPLVDGARYDYLHLNGPWATSTAVVRSGQTWSGVAGLTAMHTTYVCNVGVTCAPDATDFYRMDPDGMRYFGGHFPIPDNNFFLSGFYSLGSYIHMFALLPALYPFLI
jgi:hypothetical protein